MAFSVTTAPSVEPISTAEAKAHLRVSITADDAYIDSLITTAREYAEGYTRRALITQTITAKYNLFRNVFELERPPLQTVNSITYTDTSGVTQTIASSDYIVDAVSSPGKISPAYATSWPSSQRIINAVSVEYVAGYGDAATDVPAPIIQAMLLIIGHYYENRELAIVGVSVTDLPMAVEALLRPYRITL